MRLEESKKNSEEHKHLGIKKEFGTRVSNTDFEPAIKNSVAATSQGDLEEDRLIEQAIRASISELHLSSDDDDSNESVRRAMQASLDEASQVRRRNLEGKVEPGSDVISRGTAGPMAEVREGVQRRSGRKRADAPAQHDSMSGDGPDVDTDDDENIKIALERSQSTSDPVFSALEETEYQKAIEASKRAHDQQRQTQAQTKTEEEIVLDYVKKQSLAEDEFRRRVNH